MIINLINSIHPSFRFPKPPITLSLLFFSALLCSATFMAFLSSLLAATLFLNLIYLSLSSSSYDSSIHDLLRTKGLPAGLLPKAVKSYTFSQDGLLQVNLGRPCLTKFDTMAFYESVVTANLTYGRLTGVEGMSQEELFLWLPVKDIIVDDPKSGLILIDIGVAHKQLSFSLFEDPPDCKPQGGLKRITRKEKGFGASR